MIPLPYIDIGYALENTVNSLDIVKEMKDSEYAITVERYGKQPLNNSNYIGIGFVNDMAKSKLDTFDSDEREYVFQVSIMFKRLGEGQLEIIEKLSSLFSPLLKYAFRTSKEMKCKIHKRNTHGDIECDEDGEPIVRAVVDLRDIIRITDILPVFGQVQGDGLLMYLKFDVDEDDMSMTKEECWRITESIKEVLIYVEKESIREKTSQFRSYGYKKRK